MSEEITTTTFTGIDVSSPDGDRTVYGVCVGGGVFLKFETEEAMQAWLDHQRTIKTFTITRLNSKPSDNVPRADEE